MKRTWSNYTEIRERPMRKIICKSLMEGCGLISWWIAISFGLTPKMALLDVPNGFVDHCWFRRELVERLDVCLLLLEDRRAFERELAFDELQDFGPL